MEEGRAAPASGEQGARLSSVVMKLDLLVISGMTQAQPSLRADRTGGCGWMLRASNGEALNPKRASVIIIKKVTVKTGNRIRKKG